jgi:intracellular sulfur oxidation DsrE/DsrF family protein
MQAEHEAGVVFAACENTMKKQNVTKEQLMPFVITVDSGVAEVVRKQEAGWAYIKGGG